MDKFAADAARKNRLLPGLPPMPPPVSGQPQQFVRPSAFGNNMAHDLQRQLLAAYQDQHYSNDAAQRWQASQSLHQAFAVDRSHLQNATGARSPNPEWSEAIDALDAFDSTFFSGASKMQSSSNDDALRWNRSSDSPRREQQRSGSGESDDEEAIRNLESMGNSIFRNMTDFGDDDANVAELDTIETEFDSTKAHRHIPYAEVSGQKPASRATALFSTAGSPKDAVGKASVKGPPDITEVTDVKTLEAMLMKTLKIGGDVKKDSAGTTTQPLSAAAARPAGIVEAQYEFKVSAPHYSQLYPDETASGYLQRLPTAPPSAAQQNNQAYTYFYQGSRVPMHGGGAASSVVTAPVAFNSSAMTRHDLTAGPASPHQQQHQQQQMRFPQAGSTAIPGNYNSIQQRMMLSRSPGGSLRNGPEGAVGPFPPSRIFMHQQQHPQQQRPGYPLLPPSAAAQQQSHQQQQHQQQMRSGVPLTSTDAARRAMFMQQQQQQQQQQQRPPFLPHSPYAYNQTRSFPPLPPGVPPPGGSRMPPIAVARGEVRTFVNSNLSNEFRQLSPPEQPQQQQQHQQRSPAANYQQQLQQFYQQHGLPKANSYAGGGYCRFYGWMTEYERNLVLTQKECQTKTNNPYIDDYYYFHWRMVYDRSGVPKPMLRQRNWVEDISNMVLPPKACGALNVPQDQVPYTLQFRGSLGKISTLSVFAPRQMIDVGPDDVIFQCEQSEKIKQPKSNKSMLEKSVDADDVNQIWHERRRLMMQVENLYVSMLNLEDSCRRLRILAGRATQPNTKALLNNSNAPGVAVDEVDAAPSASFAVKASTTDEALAVELPPHPAAIADSSTPILVRAINAESAQFSRILTSCYNLQTTSGLANNPKLFGSESSSNETRMLFCILTLAKGRQWLVRLLFQLPQPYLDEFTSFLLEALVCRRSEYRRVQRLSPSASTTKPEEEDSAAKGSKQNDNDKESSAAEDRFDPLVPSPLFQVRVGIVDAIVLVEKLAASVGRLTTRTTFDTVTAAVDGVATGKLNLDLAVSKSEDELDGRLKKHVTGNDAAADRQTNTVSSLPPIDLQEFIMDNLAQVEIAGTSRRVEDEKRLLKSLGDKSLPPTLHQLGDVSLGFILLAIALYHDKLALTAANTPVAPAETVDDDEKEDIRQVARDWSPVVSCDALVLLVALFSRDHSAAIKRAAQKANVNAARHVQLVFRLLNESELLGDEKHRGQIEELLREYMQATVAAEAATAAAQQQQQQEKLSAAGNIAMNSAAVAAAQQQLSLKNYAARTTNTIGDASNLLNKVSINDLLSPSLLPIVSNNVLSAAQSPSSPSVVAKTPVVVVAAKPPPVQSKASLMAKQLLQHQQPPQMSKPASSSSLVALQQQQAVAAGLRLQQQQMPQTPNDFLAEMIKRFL